LSAGNVHGTRPADEAVALWNCGVRSIGAAAFIQSIRSASAG
jgi:hypothetical protein